MKTYSERAKTTLNPTGQRLLLLMDEKQTNLSLAADVTSASQLLELADEIGPEICVFKTHIDIIEDFTPSLTHKLRELAAKHNFLIFEDRKFADIGNTVKWQYQSGIYHIADWSEITNAHLTPGPGVIEGLKEVGLPRGHGLLLLAQMSSKGSLTHPKKAVEWALEHEDFVIGFICLQKLSDHPSFIHMTPGIKRAPGGDNLGQQYLTPEKVIGELKSDVIIVGRGIYEDKNPQAEAAVYRELGWQSYQKRL